VFSLSLAGGPVKPLSTDGHVSGLSLGKGVLVYARDSLGGPAQIFEQSADGKAHALTQIGQDTLGQTPLSAFEAFSFPGWNDEPVHGYVVKPTNYQPGHKYPVAFLIHGGPHGSFGNAWSYRWNPQVWAGMGYAVVTVNFHGSSGYGEAFAKSIVGHWGDRPLTDLQKGWAYALSRYDYLDGDHACALGGSYGGFMMNWVAGQWPDGFKCIVSHDGIFDQRSMYYSTEELWFPEHEFGGPEYRNPDGYAKFNPIDYVTRWKTPTLVIHGQEDYRIPLAQGLAVFTALQRQGVPSEFLYFPNENHWVLKPADSIQWYDTVLAWMNRWSRP
jgi:dipeptidyl aminopeptidase/acylaminoacyl peptidase